MRRFNDLTWKLFGSLKVLAYAPGAVDMAGANGGYAARAVVAKRLS